MDLLSGEDQEGAPEVTLELQDEMEMLEDGSVEASMASQAEEEEDVMGDIVDEFFEELRARYSKC